jgi:hypothetical protein
MIGFSGGIQKCDNEILTFSLRLIISRALGGALPYSRGDTTLNIGAQFPSNASQRHGGKFPDVYSNIPFRSEPITAKPPDST